MIARLVHGVARAVLIAAGILLVAALLLAVIGCRLIMWPYRATHAGNAGTRGKLEASLTLINAAGALLATLRPEPQQDEVGSPSTETR